MTEKQGMNHERTQEYLRKFDREKSLKYLIKTKKPVIFDIGANTGTTVVDFKKWWPEASIHAFEPLPECWNDLERATSKYSDSIIINKFALGNEDQKKAVMFTHNPSDMKDSRGISGFLKINTASEDSILLKEKTKIDTETVKQYYESLNHKKEVQMVTGETYINECKNDLKKIDLVKIDVQGFEPEVLDGFGSMLSKVDVVISELKFYDYYERSLSFSDLEKIFHKAGFKLYDISHISKNPMNGRTDWVDVIYVRDKKNYASYASENESNSSSFTENEIRPERLIQEYKDIREEDAKDIIENSVRNDVQCVGCGSSNLKQEFTKFSFIYSSCKDCGTLFQSPRPSPNCFEDYYKDSKSATFWASKFLPAVENIRREKIFKPRARKILDIAEEHGKHVEKIADIGAGSGLMLDEFRKIHPTSKLLAIEPSGILADACRKKDIPVEEDLIENIKNQENSCDLVTCFEVLEHVYDPHLFIKNISNLLKPGGIMIVTTLSVDGFDIQFLWEKSEQISPPHHINFLSTKGFKHLFKRAGLNNIHVITPGVLDVDIVKNAINKDQDLKEKNEFLSKLITNPSFSQKFQNLITESGLSSHAWIIAEKPF